MPRLDSNVLWSWATGPLSPVAVVAVLLATTYLVLYVNARRGPRAPALGRAVVFILGCAVMFTATTTGLQTYSRELLSAFMFQQLTLLLIVPPLLILGSRERCSCEACRVADSAAVCSGWRSAFSDPRSPG